MKLYKKIQYLIGWVVLLCVLTGMNSTALAVTGPLTADTTWSGTVSVTGDVTVSSGVTLAIEAGSSIEFAALSDDQAGGTDASRSELIIDGGSLIIQGTAGNPVALASDAFSPSAGDRFGIRVINNGDLDVRHANIQHAVSGIDYQLNGVLRNEVIIEDTTLSSMTQNGIHVYGLGGAQLTATLRGNTIFEVGHRGVVLLADDDSTVVTSTLVNNVIHNAKLNGVYFHLTDRARLDAAISDNTVHTTGGGTSNHEERAGIRLHYNNGNTQSSTLTVSNNEVYGSASYGIYADNFRSSQNLRLQGNTVHDNGNHGIYIFGKQEGTINPVLVGNRVYSNEGEGIRIYDQHISQSRFDSAMHTQFSLNEVYANAATGVVLVTAEAAHVVNNSIHGNESNGLYLQTNQPSYVNFNNLYDNQGDYDIYNDGGFAIDGRYNSWGESTVSELEAGTNNLSRIYDARDDGSKGAVDVNTWATARWVLHDNPTSWVKSPVDGSTLKASSYTITGSAVAKSPIDRVEVSTDGGLSWQTAQGFSAGAAGTNWLGWQYQWTVPGEGDYTIRSRVISEGQIEDPGPGNRATIDNDLLTTSGQLGGDEIWSGTVDITGDIRIPSDVTLTLTAGTQVTFKALSDDQNGGADASRSEILVDGGRLIVMGTAENKVMLTSAAGDPENGDWQGIRVINGGALQIQHAELQHAVNGVVYTLNSAVEGELLIEDSLFSEMSKNGVYIQGNNGAQLTATLRGNTIFEVGHRGVVILADDDSTVVTSTLVNNVIHNAKLNGVYFHLTDRARLDAAISDNTVHTTGGGTSNHEERAGIRLHYNNGNTQSSTLTVSNNEVYGSASYGIYADNFRSSQNLRLQGNTVHDNGNHGIYIFGKQEGTINPVLVGNRVYSNEGEGIRIYDQHISQSRFDSAMHTQFSLNEVYANAATGVVLVTAEAAHVVNNSIHENVSNGLYLQTHQPSYVNFNNLYDNQGDYDIYNDGGFAVDGRYNSWGESTVSELEADTNNLSRIYDARDADGKGAVDVSTWQKELLTLQTTPTSWVKSPVDGSRFKASTYMIMGSAVSPLPVDRVEVSTDNGISWQDALGFSAGTAGGTWLTWHYAWSVPGDGDYTVRSRVITADGQIETPAVGHLVSIDGSQFTAKGQLTNDEIWSGTVNVLGDLTVPAGINLTILPGTVVNMTALNDDSKAGVDSSRIEWNVHGSLIANGTLGQPITISSAAPSKAPNDWYGLTVTGNLNLNHTTIEYAHYGIRCESNSVPSASCLIENSILQHHGGDALYVYASNSTTPEIRFRDSTLANISGRGICGEKL